MLKNVLSGVSPYIAIIDFRNMEDGYDYSFKIKHLMEIELVNKKDRFNIYKNTRSLDNMTKYFEIHNKLVI